VVDAEASLDRLSSRAAAATAERAAAERAKAEAERALQQAQSRLEQDAPRESIEERETEARGTVSTRRAARNALIAEIDSLDKALAADNKTDASAAVMTRMRANPGYEAALAAALGEDAAAPELQGFSEKARGWLALKLLGTSPQVGEPLSEHVEAPAALARRLAVTSVVSRAEVTCGGGMDFSAVPKRARGIPPLFVSRV